MRVCRLPEIQDVGELVGANRHFFAIALVIAAASLAPVGDLFAKLLSVSYAAVFICFGRYFAGGAIGLGVLICS